MTAQPSSLAGSADSHWLAPALEMAAQTGGGWAPAGLFQIATLTPAMDAGCAGVARAFASLTLRRWGAAGRADDVLTVVSELVTNAWRHALPAAALARRPVQLGVLRAGRGVLCAVADPSPQPPVPRESWHLGETGRGLQVIAALSDRWGCAAPREGGKIVWALFTAVPGLAAAVSWPPLR